MPNFIKQAQGGIVIPQVDDWKSISISGLTTNLTGFTTASKYFYRRVGDSLEIRCDLRKDTNAGSGANDVIFTLPDNLLIDSTKCMLSFGYLGVGSLLNEGSNSVGVIVMYYNTSSVKLWLPIAARAYQAQDCAASDYIGFNAMIPIQGWGSNGVIRGITDISAAQVKGRVDGVAPSTAYIGETLSQQRLRSAAISLTSLTQTNVLATPLTLTPGTWKISGEIAFEGSGVTSNYQVACISKTSATMPSTDVIATPTSGEARIYQKVNLASDIVNVPIDGGVVNISTSTIFYLVAYSSFTPGTVTVYGSIRATRIA